MGLAVWSPTLILGLRHQWPVEPDASGCGGVCCQTCLKHFLNLPDRDTDPAGVLTD
jgi:hypothetical protein